MNCRNIIILGDSTSMSIGVERENYSFMMADNSVWPKGNQIINCSLPGFTSADIAAFFFKHKELWANKLSAAVIYIGNCDAASSEVKKGRFGYLKELYNGSFLNRAFEPNKTKLKNRLLHYEWNNDWDPSLEAPEHPNNFEFNINRILKACDNENIPVVLVRPKANHYFLPGLGKGNFIFYRFLNVNDHISQIISIPDPRFKAALKHHEDGELNAAVKIYKEILLKQPVVSMGDEYYQIIVNNYAAAKCQLGNVEEAIYLFNLLLKERSVRQEIILYNIAQVFKLSGDEVSYSDFIRQSYEADHSLYRVRGAYLNIIDNLLIKYPNIKIIDMENLIPDEFYLDHCHVLPEGQAIIAREVISSLKKHGISGEEKSQIKNILYNPELSLGNFQSFHEYFKTYSKLSENEIDQNVKIIKEKLTKENYANLKASLLEIIPESLINSIEYYLRHPCFPDVADVIKSPPRYPADVGRFPEFYLVRYVIPFARVHEKNDSLKIRFSTKLDLLRSSIALSNILPEGLVVDDDLDWSKLDLEYEKQKMPKILSKVYSLLLDHLLKKNQVYERTKSTMFWYVREALRFGAHSRYSMLYDRILLEYLAEGLMVAGVVDHFLELGVAGEISRLIAILEKVTLVHESYCSKFSMKQDGESFLRQYDNELISIAQELKD